MESTWSRGEDSGSGKPASWRRSSQTASSPVVKGAGFAGEDFERRAGRMRRPPSDHDESLTPLDAIRASAKAPALSPSKVSGLDKIVI